MTPARRDEIGLLLYELWTSARTEIARDLADLELTPIQAHVLRQLDPASPTEMSELASTLGCDASNVTGLVDRLEARGLVERRSSASDRRVRELVVTEAGRDVRARALRLLTRAPAPIRRLDRAEREQLAALLRQALGDTPAG